MIAEAIRQKIRERGIAWVAGEAFVSFGSALFWAAFYGAAAGLIVGVGVPALALERFTRLWRKAPGCSCVNSFDECRCGRGAP